MRIIGDVEIVGPGGRVVAGRDFRAECRESHIGSAPEVRAALDAADDEGGSGADAARRGWAEAAFPHHNQQWQPYAVTGGLYHLIQARVLRPSYALLLLCRAGNALTRLLEVNAADQLHWASPRTVETSP